jgi:transcriptional regulator with XRE-family HTH domain
MILHSQTGDKMRGVQVNGEVIRFLRTGKGLTQDQLALAANLDVTTLRKMEKGNKTFDFRSVLAIANSLNTDFARLITPDVASPDRRPLHLEIVHRWHGAMLAGDAKALRLLYTADTLLELPGADGLSAAGNFQGIDAVVEHHVQFFQVFQIRSVREDDFVIHAVENLVFLRTTATIEYLPAAKSYTTRHVNEIEFRDGLIARRTTVADYGQLRQAVESEPEA